MNIAMEASMNEHVIVNACVLIGMPSTYDFCTGSFALSCYDMLK